MDRKKPVVAFDVDGTLFDDKGQPRWDIIGILRALLPYCTVVVWSGSGLDYAKHAGRQLFLPPEVKYHRKNKSAKELFEETGMVYPSIGGRPITGIDIAFDDQDTWLAEVNIRV